MSIGAVSSFFESSTELCFVFDIVVDFGSGLAVVGVAGGGSGGGG